MLVRKCIPTSLPIYRQSCRSSGSSQARETEPEPGKRVEVVYGSKDLQLFWLIFPISAPLQFFVFLG